MTDRISTSLTPRIISDASQMRAVWTASKAQYGNAQSFEWIEGWRKHVNADLFIAGLFASDAPIMLLPLEIVRIRGICILRYPGGSHANCNFPWVAGYVEEASLQSLVAAIRNAYPQADVLSLTRQLPSLSGTANPLLKLRSEQNHNPVLIASTADGFDSIVARGNAKRKLKKHRQHMRRYEEAGGWRIYSPATRDESDQILGTFFALKARRFRQMGVCDPFSAPDIQAFFREIFGNSVGQPDRRYELTVLEVGGKTRSVIGKAFSGQSISVDFNAIADDELMTASPGEFLFFEDIKSSCESGVATYSLGIGDEPYKREWCDIRESVYDTVIPLSLKGRAYTLLQKLRGRLAAKVKGNPRLWQFTKTLRRKYARR